jgi:gluconolactonase
VDFRLLTRGLAFAEGPTFDSHGTLFVCETGAGKIAAISPDGRKRTHAEPGGGPCGLVVGADGALYCANFGGFAWDGSEPDITDGYEYGRIERVAHDGTVEVLYKSCDDAPLGGPDDITVDPEGWLWFTDPGHGDLKSPRGRLFAAAPDGSAIHEVGAGYQFSNGLAFMPDGASLVVAETGSGWLWVHSVLPGRRLAERRELVRLPRGFKPDGLCLDEEGNILVAGTFGGGLFVYTPSGELIDQFLVDDPYITNLAFGGPSFDELFVTCGGQGTVLVATWGRPGLQLPFGASAKILTRDQ